MKMDRRMIATFQWVCCLGFVVMPLLPASLTHADDAVPVTESGDNESDLFKGLLQSLSIRRREKPAPKVKSGISAPLPASPKPKMVSAPASGALPTFGPRSGIGVPCPSCGLAMKNGKCGGAGGGGTCNIAATVVGSVGAQGTRTSAQSTGMPQGTSRQDLSGQSISSNGNQSGTSSSPAGPKPSGANSPVGTVTSFNGLGGTPRGDGRAQAGVAPSRRAMASGMRAGASSVSEKSRISGTSMGQQVPGPLAAIDEVIAGIGGMSGRGTQGVSWQVVRPAGMGPESAVSAISLESGETDDSGDAKRAYQLDSGIARSTLQTGPKNPLLVPAKVASVVYVVDCSGSMQGGKFIKVKAAIADAVSQMSDNQQFAVLMFTTQALQAGGGGLRYATQANKNSLASELSQISPGGGTDPTDALLIAVQMQPETIVAFSDGEFPEEIVHRVSSLNRSSGLNCQINCVGVGASVSALRLLSSLNGPGNYLEAH